MSYQFIRTDANLTAYLEQIRSNEWIALDTEFISEGKYRSELCLIQAATADGPVLIDAPAIADLTPFWVRLCAKETLVLVHSCRSELEFCFRSIGRLPKNVFDIQLAAGFVGGDYPSSFKKIADQFVHIEIPKGETRTDWRKRPLSILQVEYALNDVLYLERIGAELTCRLKETGRLGWFASEMRSYLARLKTSFDDDRWQRMAGIASLGRAELAIVRELWRWREKKAAKKNRPVNRFLRDDVIVELARRKTADPDRIGALRSLARRKDLSILQEELPLAIARALALPADALPSLSWRESYPHYTVLTQFLMTVLCNEAKRSDVALNLLATPQDVRDFIAHRAGTLPEGGAVRLDAGWRKELLDGRLDRVLNGQVALCVADFLQNDPIKTVEL